jgi:hypothetical protein
VRDEERSCPCTRSVPLGFSWFTFSTMTIVSCIPGKQKDNRDLVDSRHRFRYSKFVSLIPKSERNNLYVLDIFLICYPSVFNNRPIPLRFLFFRRRRLRPVLQPNIDISNTFNFFWFGCSVCAILYRLLNVVRFSIHFRQNGKPTISSNLSMKVPISPSSSSMFILVVVHC